MVSNRLCIDVNSIERVLSNFIIFISLQYSTNDSLCSLHIPQLYNSLFTMLLFLLFLNMKIIFICLFYGLQWVTVAVTLVFVSFQFLIEALWLMFPFMFLSHRYKIKPKLSIQNNF